MKKNLLFLFTTVMLLGMQLFAQRADVTVTGTVFNERNESVPGATILVKGTQTGVTTF